MGAATGHGLGEQMQAMVESQRHFGVSGPSRKLLSMDASLSNVFLSQVGACNPQPSE